MIFSGIYNRLQKKFKGPIGYARFIGMGVTILPNVTIGPNSIVGAGSLVTKDVQPNSVYAGVPAKFICTMDEYKTKCKEAPL